MYTLVQGILLFHRLIFQLHHIKECNNKIPVYIWKRIRNLQLLHQKQNKIKTFKVSYCAVFYYSQFYVGRALRLESSFSIRFKFLHETFPGVFTWPFKDEIDVVDSKFVFHGPVALQGTCPFSLPEYSKVKQLYKSLKR